MRVPQDGHRQRTVNWCDSTGGTAAAFDFTTKGILQSAAVAVHGAAGSVPQTRFWGWRGCRCGAQQSSRRAVNPERPRLRLEALGRGELWRLVDAQGRPPGLLGMWASRAITFIDNHDTGSTLNHWPFPSHHLQASSWGCVCAGAGAALPEGGGARPEGYAYILLHPGTPCVFIDHISGDGKLRQLILDLVAVRKSYGINSRSKVAVRKAAGDVYAATIDDKIALKIGRGDWSPNSAGINVGQKEWKLTVTGHNVAVWVAVMS
ncbi:alpha-amylase, putative [Monoraphidium neglectum]|uniref:alpha-amylase n=1 Tax=Monoraphidium neglectum TaxID=145388 RepID=A0A0D2MH55_9CHLO|nr:alpha-amylase, putative [Monoraphidium neglectum]KIY94390.1 alpha-amylase, putative [Monoraphidium neglectum]|eukprot:XP_013893410.1 alpha-amylase, putative [Monoraphidium neglectum]